MTDTLPLIVEPEQLTAALARPNVLLVDLSAPETYVQYHIPAAVYLEYPWIIHMEKPRMGLLPDKAQLANVLSALGLTPATHVIAYDDEGGGRACRFLWTLDCVGHRRFSLLNGGLIAWTNEGREVTSRIKYPTAGNYEVKVLQEEPIADRQYILDHMNHQEVVILDARSAAEYSGAKLFAARGGHIPGAVNIDWTEAMDRSRHMRLKPAAQLRSLLQAKGITPDKTIVCHCQSHHRSAHTYIMLKSLGYAKIKGYPGSWSDWGNDASTPIEN